MQSPISSGRYGHLTETGSFKVIEKERSHHSSIYGKIVDGYGRTIVADADVDMHVPGGCRFVPAPMPYFMRFHGSDGMHAGYLPGYPASHGCVRMPDQLRSTTQSKLERRSVFLGERRERINIIAMVHNRSADPGRGPGNRSVRNTNRALRFTSRVRLIRKRTPPVRLGLTAAAQPFS